MITKYYVESPEFNLFEVTEEQLSKPPYNKERLYVDLEEHEEITSKLKARIKELQQEQKGQKKLPDSIGGAGIFC